MPPTDDSRSRGVGHTLDAADGACLETCPHPDHHGPVSVVMLPQLKRLMDDWLSDLGVESRYFPAAPDEHDGMRQYVVIVKPGHPLMQPSSLDRAFAAREDRL